MPLTIKQKQILSGAWRQAVSTYAGCFLTEGFIQGVGSWAGLIKAVTHGLLIGTASTVINEARYWKQWADDPPSVP